MRIPIDNLTNNSQLKHLVESKRLSLPVALTIFNRGRSDPVTESTFKAWFADPNSEVWRELSSADLEHAQRALAAIT